LQYLPESEGGTPETSRIVTTSENSRIKMGINWNGFYSWVTPYPNWL
jgi:hypothetical protein